jgi:hypothetical protein
MIITIEFINALEEKRRKINRMDINDIEWYEDDVKLNISKDRLDEWSFIGLNNIDFITTGFYKYGWNKTKEETNK